MRWPVLAVGGGFASGAIAREPVNGRAGFGEAGRGGNKAGGVATLEAGSIAAFIPETVLSPKLPDDFAASFIGVAGALSGSRGRTITWEEPAPSRRSGRIVRSARSCVSRIATLGMAPCVALAIFSRAMPLLMIVPWLPAHMLFTTVDSLKMASACADGTEWRPGFRSQNRFKGMKVKQLE
jgi:hypothetical protein